MAYKILDKTGGKAQDIAKLKKVEGYLRLVKFTKKTKTRNASAIYQIGDIDVWGCSNIDQNLLVGDIPKAHIPPHLIGCKVRLTFKGKKKIAGRSQPMKVVIVEVDDTDKEHLPAGRVYKLRK